VAEGKVRAGRSKSRQAISWAATVAGLFCLIYGRERQVRAGGMGVASGRVCLLPQP
jgi:hypothetical protein